MLGGLAAVAALAAGTPATQAASSDGCEGGGFTLRFPSGRVLSGEQKLDLTAAQIGSGRIQVRGRYNEFDIQTGSFAVFNYERLVRKVYKDHFYFAAVICIHCTW